MTHGSECLSLAGASADPPQVLKLVLWVDLTSLPLRALEPEHAVNQVGVQNEPKLQN